MKKIVKSLILIAAAAMGFTACQEELQNDAPLTEETVEVKFVASSADTKTSVDTSGDAPLFAWGENETFTVLEQTDALAEATSVTYEKVDGKANITATFDANADKGEYKYATIYPASGYVSAESLAAATLSLPAVQTMAEGSYDPAADLMVSEVVSANAQPTEAQMVRFTRLAAVAEMKLKNLALAEGDQVEQVIFTAEGKNLAGTVTADLNDPHNDETRTFGETVDNVTVNTTSSSDVYFTLLPTTLEAGAAYTVTVITKEKLYIKTGTIPAEKSLAFEAGMVTRFGVNMEGIVPSEKWVLVRDASTLKQGDVVTIAAKNHNYVMSANWASNYPYASAKAVIKVGDYLYHPDGTANNEMVQKLTLAKRDNSRNAFDFYDGKSGFLMAPGSGSKYLKLQEYYSFNTQFDITIDSEGVATIIATNATGTSKQMMYNHNSSYATSRYFHCYSEITDPKKKICLYKLEDKEGTLPTVTPNIEVSDVVISEDETADATAISDVVFNYVGDWTITPSVTYEEGTDTGWLNVTYNAENNCLTYTAEANAGAKRNATVTLTATLGGQDDITFAPFTVTQKGVPTEITIEEFKQKTKDVDAVYKLTGVITAISASSGNAYTLSDGNGTSVDITYLYTDADEKVYDNESIDLAKGDVVTVTTVVAGSTAGKGGSSSYHSIYKGHYGLKTTAGLAADYTGGTVEVSVETYSNGNIEIPEPVQVTIAESDFAELSYSDGVATVTFATENTTAYAREAELTFTYGMTSVVVIVQQGINPANKLGYELVTDASTLVVGDEVIIVAVGSDKALGCYTGSSTITGISNIPAVDIVKSGKVIYDVEEAGVMLLTLQSGLNEGEFTFQFTHKSSDYYLNAPSSGLKGRAASSGANNSTSFAITIDAITGVATVQSTYPRVIKFNSKTGANFTGFKLDDEGASLDTNNIAIYKKQK